MKSLSSVSLSIVIGLIASSSMAASQSKTKLSAATAPAPAPATVNEVKVEAKEVSSAAPTTTTAIISTNFADISRNRMGITLDAMMTQTAAVAIGFTSQSQKEEREKLAGKPKMSVDRNQFSVGGSFYYRPMEAKYNAALAPALVFQTEKDAVNTDSTNGVKLSAMGLFKPLPRLMFQGGAIVSVLGSETSTDALVGMGLMF